MARSGRTISETAKDAHEAALGRHMKALSEFNVAQINLNNAMQDAVDLERILSEIKEQAE